MTGQYDDIINFPHHEPVTRPRMPSADRAVQFAPFAALTGFGAAIAETGRLTEKQIQLDETEKAALNDKLNRIASEIQSRPLVTVTYFLPDRLKSGGSYVTETDNVKKLDSFQLLLVMENGNQIPFVRITAIEFPVEIDQVDI